MTSTGATTEGHAHGGTAVLALGALGVVFGDIGTSPLYAFREAFEHQDLAGRRDQRPRRGLDRLLGAGRSSSRSSTWPWSCGPTTTARAASSPSPPWSCPRAGAAERGRGWCCSACSAPRCSTATASSPRPSRCSARSRASRWRRRRSTTWVLPIACVILVGLFVVQRRGTGAVGKVFGPVMVVWFAVLGVLGLAPDRRAPRGPRGGQPDQHRPLLRRPSPARRSSPSAASSWSSPAARRSTPTWATSAAGRSPLAWYGLVLPGLLLNYFGQAALLIDDPEAVESPFYRLAPDVGRHAAGGPGHDGVGHRLAGPDLRGVLAHRAGGAARLPAAAARSRHTSGEHQGQVYVPLVNWALMIGCIGLVLGFRSSSNLAAAYGIAVTATMVITSILFFVRGPQAVGLVDAPRRLLVVTPLLARRHRLPRRQRPEDPRRRLVPAARRPSACWCRWRRGAGAAQLVADADPAGRARRRRRARRARRRRRACPAPPCSCSRTPARRRRRWSTTCAHNKVLHETHRRGRRRAPTTCRRVGVDDRAEVEHRGAAASTRSLLHFGFMEEPDVPAGARSPPATRRHRRRRRRHLLRRPRVGAGRRRRRGACTPPSSSSTRCCTAAPTAPPGSSSSPPTRSSRSANTLSCRR